MADQWDRVSALATEMGVTIGFKDESRLMRLLGRILFFNKAFMTTFTTTIGSTVYVPTRDWLAKNRWNAALVLSHELTHVQDNRNEGYVRYVLAYLLPELLALTAPLALLAIWSSPWWLLALGGLLGLVPFKGSKGRAHIEYRGYATTMACLIWSGEQVDEAPDWIMSEFTGPNYFWMDPDKSRVQFKLNDWIKIIKTEPTTLDANLPMAPKLRAIWQSPAT